MTRFFFNFRQDASYAVDDVGCEFKTVEEAYLSAMNAARDMWRDLLFRRENPLGCSFEVTDRSGNNLFSLPFSEVLEACNGRPAGVTPGRVQSTIAEALIARGEAARAMSEISAILEQAKATLRETLLLLDEVGRRVEPSRSE